MVSHEKSVVFQIVAHIYSCLENYVMHCYIMHCFILAAFEKYYSVFTFQKPGDDVSGHKFHLVYPVWGIIELNSVSLCLFQI